MLDLVVNVSSFNFGDNLHIFIMVASLYIPTSTAQQFSFLHIFTNTCCILIFDNSHSDRCVVESHCAFDLHSADNLWCWGSFHVLFFFFPFHVLLNRPYVFFGKTSIQVLWPVFNQFLIVFWYWVVWLLYILWILTPYRVYHMQYVLPFSKLPCILLVVSSTVENLFTLM